MERPSILAPPPSLLPAPLI
uniref:Wilms' tumor mRNA n=1 Tax=Mus musculus TaxID=10090 RepID=V9GZH3_MOUSE|nr:short ORF [Mus musculus]